METVGVILINRAKAKIYYFDLMAIAAIYLIPSLSHLLNFPVYLFEPMRLVLILAVVHTSKANAFIIAVTLPLFSFLISLHPSLVKAGLITTELLLNVFLFFLLIKSFQNKFVVALFSILLSKVYYYAIKFLLLSLVLQNGNLFSTPIYIQIIMTLVFSTYAYSMLRNKGELSQFM
jgi:hypothetical protein